MATTWQLVYYNLHALFLILQKKYSGCIKIIYRNMHVYYKKLG